MTDKAHRRRPIATLFAFAALCAAARPSPAEANAEAAHIQQDSLALFELQARAVAIDPRTEQAELQRRAMRLRTQNLDVSLRPGIQLRGDASYQSEVTRIPLTLGGDQVVPEPPKERYEATVETNWTLWDGGLTGASRDLERSRLTSEIAALDTELHTVRVEVTDAFFSALVLQEHVAETSVLLEDLEARLSEVRERVRQGAALPGDTALIRAELLGARQARDALTNELRVARDLLSLLTGTAIDPSDILVLPELSEALERNAVPTPALGMSGALPMDLRVHPQFAVFDAQRTSADQQAELIGLSRRPQISAFGQLSLGSPGFEQFTNDPHEYWRAGLRLQWVPWNWGRRDRQVEEIRVQQLVIDTQEAAFSDRLLRALQRPMRTIEYMRTALESDDEIVALREQVEMDARNRFAERAISGSAYTDALTNLQEARIARVRHRAELARAQAHYLITLGAELR